MKLSTTPVSKFTLALKGSLIVASIIALVGSPFLINTTVKADRFDDKIAALQEEINGYQQTARRLASKADTLQRQLNKLSAEKAALQARIDLNQTKYDKLTNRIKETKQQIAENKDALGETLLDLYIQGDITALEMLASSDNISDFIDKQAYQKNLRDSLSAKIKEIEALKTKLEKDKKETERVLDDQKAQRTILANKEAQRQNILNKTRGSEQAYQNMISNRKGKIAELRAEQAAVAAAIAAGGNGAHGGSASSASGYPFYPNGCSYTNDGYGYFKCQCVSYVAYRLAANPANRGFAYLGNASSWWNYGKTISAGNVARGDVIVWLTGPYGHVMFVESVSGGTIYFTDFNGFGGALSPGQGTISTAAATSGGMKVIRFH